MKLIETASLLIPSAMAGSSNFDNLYAQHRSLSTANHLVKKLNMITERRIFPELVSTNEGGFTAEQRDEYEGHYAMEQPNVNFLLDFGNEELVKFRIHSQTYQQKTSYLEGNDWGAKKSGSSGWGSSAFDDEIRDEDQWYKDYQENHIERFTRPTRANLLRRIASQEMMIQYVSKTKRRFGAFFNYGCHCFPGSFIDPRHSPHALPVDDIDKACREHSWAYDCAKQDFGNDCRGKYQLYNWIGTINADGYTHDISCTDEENTCSWAICQADKHLAERLAELPYEYRADFLVAPQDSSVNPFDRVGQCNLQEVEDTSRDSHNNNENVYLNDYTQAPAEPVAQEPVEPQIVAQSAAQPGFGNEPAFPSVPILSPADFSADRGLGGPEGFGSFGPLPADGASFGQGQAPAAPAAPVAPVTANQPNWAAMTLEERRKWAEVYGLEIPEEFKEPKPVEEYVYQPGNIQFGTVPAGSNGPQIPEFADAVAQVSQNAGAPAFTHASTEAPATDDELNGALEQVANVASQVNTNQLYADDANTYVFDDTLPNPDRSVFEEPVAPAAVSAAQPAEAEIPEVVMKSAVTHHYRQCCGQYPTRYKFSTKRMGCCNDNGIERLYNPTNSKCCHVKSARGVSGSMASYLARSSDDCEDAFNN